MVVPERLKMTYLHTIKFLHSLAHKARLFFTTILYPRHCPFCGRILTYGEQICNSCRQKLPLIHGPVCYHCGKPLNQSRQELCYDCRIFPKSFDQGLALLLYNSMTRTAISAFKYHNQRYMADYFARAIYHMHSHQINKWQVQAIIPIPIHKNKRKKRGYNQAELLAKCLARELNLPDFPDFILRKTDTLPQKQFSPQARLNNLNKAFELNPKYLSCTDENPSFIELNNLHSVLLIDDIYTTGATMESCTRLLKKAGIRSVYIYSVCIGISRDEII